MSKKVVDIISGLSLTIETKCARCGKVFEQRGDEWAYRGRGSRGGTQENVFYCSWGCMRAAEKDKPKPKLRGTGYKGEMKKEENA